MKHIILIILILISSTAYSEQSKEFFDSLKKNNIEKAKILIAQGIDPTENLWTAVRWNNTELVNLLIKKGAKPTEDNILVVAINVDTDILEVLIENGANVNFIEPPYEFSILGNAARETGAWVESEIKAGRYSGPTPDRLRTVKLLVQAGADINHVDKFNDSPLRLAVAANNSEIAKFLIGKGANINQYDDQGYQNGYSIIMEAIYWYGLHKDLSVIEALLKAGANPNEKGPGHRIECIPDRDCIWKGYTLLDWANENGYKDVEVLLKKYGAKNDS
jgi:ankyrin repeat protein